MSPRPLHSLGIPDTEHGRELKTLITEMAALNKSYDPDDICLSVQQDIAQALGPIEPALSERVINRRILLLILRMRSRLSQMRTESAPSEYGPLWTPGSRGCPEDAFKKVPRTVLKSVEKALTHKADRIPLEHRGQGTRELQDTVFPGYIDIDPKKLSDTLVKNLGFEHMLAPKGSPQKEKLAAKDKIVPEVKKILQHLEPLPVTPGYTEDYNFRHFRITEGPKKGYILIIQTIHGTARMVVTTLPAAQRRIPHIAAQHKLEQQILVKMPAAISDILKQLVEHWDEAKSPETLKESIASLDKMVEELEGANNFYKEKLHARLVHAGICLARKNRGATITCMRDTDTMVGHRLREIKGITQALSGDGSMLRNHVTAHATAVENLYTKVTAQKGTVRLADPGKEITDDQKGPLVARLLGLASDCENKVTFQPYLAFAERMDKYLQEAASLLQMDPPDRKRIAEFFMRAFVVSKLAHFNNQLQDIYSDVSLHGEHGIRAEALVQILIRARHQLRERSVAGGVHVSEFTPLWQRTRRLAAKLTRELEAWGTCQDTDEREIATKSIKQLIKSFDLAQRVSEIRSPEQENS